MKTAAKIVSAVAIAAAVFAVTTANAQAREYGRFDRYSRREYVRGYVACPPPVYYCQPQPTYVVPESVCVAPPAVAVCVPAPVIWPFHLAFGWHHHR